MTISKEDLEVLRAKRGNAYVDNLLTLIEIDEATKTPMPLIDHLKLVGKVRKIIAKN